MLRGRRTTMLSDADINYERHARAALGAVITSVTGDAAIFVSGGTEHQCKPGEAPIAAIVSASESAWIGAAIAGRTSCRTIAVRQSAMAPEETALIRGCTPWKTSSSLSRLSRSLVAASLACAFAASPPRERRTRPPSCLPGSANDQSWNALGYSILKSLEPHGFKTAYSENVSDADEAEALRDYASQGYLHRHGPFRPLRLGDGAGGARLPQDAVHRGQRQ